MSQEHRGTRTPRHSRRGALRTGAKIGAVGTGLAMGTSGVLLGGASPARAQGAAWRAEHIEVVFTPLNPVSIVRAGSGPAQRGDWFYTDGPIYAPEDVGGQPIGVYQCFGAWTNAGSDSGAPDQRFTSVQFRLADGAIMGLINEGGADPGAHVGAVQGGTGRYASALGTFRQQTLTGGVTGVSPGQTVVRGVLDLMLPNPGP